MDFRDAVALSYLQTRSLNYIASGAEEVLTDRACPFGKVGV